MTGDDRVRGYVHAVMRNLYLKNEYRQQVAEDLRAHIAEAIRERSIDEVLEDLGHPRKIAAEIMEAYEDDYEKMGFLNAIAYAQQVQNFDVQSAAKIGDWPLVHIATGYNKAGEKSVARGIIAFGDVAIGCVAMGSVALGVVAFGAISAGVIALGAVAAGLLVAIGAGAFSIIASMGAAAISVVFAFGALALSRFWAMGAYARAIHYVDAYGESQVVPVWMRSFIHTFEAHPGWLAFAIAILSGAFVFVPMAVQHYRQRNFRPKVR